MEADLGRRRGRNGERSSFATACSALSQYIKAKGSIADLGLGVASPEGKLEEPRPPATMVLLPGLDVSGGSGNETSASATDADAREPKKAPLTIFYGGKVLVFDSFPADKTEDLMQLAEKGISTVQTSSTSATTLDAHPTDSSNPEMTAPVTNSDAFQGELKKQDLPIARKASLKRFLERRKKRFDARAPYEVSGFPGSLPQIKSEEGKSRLGLERRSGGADFAAQQIAV